MTALEPLLLTEPEAAAQLRLCPRTLREARKRGALRYVLIGRAVRYTLPDLNAWIDSLRREAPPCPAPSPRQSGPRRRSGVIVPFTARG